ncbi:G0/G1 switch protein 2 isoform X2 [Melanotaenia boesemani]|uniref:G0/G1 switch protein 2 isoform X2 n=1 Tax=Melanotaenia boesemani TaxID=1250792 RepID=UPI001C05E552|nr:G0/G1 switch protein 2 isoform X2 [Melanotaenia boesemani]
MVQTSGRKFRICSELQLIKYKKMENSDNIILFAKEMLRQGPSRSMLKIYMLGSTLAMLGMVGGLVEMVFLPFMDSHVTEEEQAKFFLEKKKERKQVLKLQSTLVHTEAEAMLGVVLSEAKAKHLGTAVQRSSANRLHAS